MGPRGPVGDPIPLLKGTEDVCFVDRGFFGRYGDRHRLQAHRHPPTSLRYGRPVPPGCPRTGLEPLSLGGAARWSPRAPPPLDFQGVDWLASQPIPHHAPWESS